MLAPLPLGMVLLKPMTQQTLVMDSRSWVMIRVVRRPEQPVSEVVDVVIDFSGWDSPFARYVDEWSQ